MRRPILHLLLVAALVLLTTHYWNPGPGTAATAARGTPGGPLPTSYIDNARSRSFSADGTLSDILESSRVEQFRKPAYTMLYEPRFYAHSAHDRTWSASADRGRYAGNGQRLLLRQNVVLSHDQTGTQLTTASLDIQLDTREAQTRSAVTITQAGNATRANGMLARLNQETIRLGPDVESIYVQIP
ncbi:LPS export ABC transporter periplasmic protein LptC [Haliea sp. E17]|uniref:LPS export ABC transporter periplasmic protein LptC n=1 Tax=Haliea sp. E17 TaxID=3401576 RepID=UPI003AAE45A7